MRGDPHGRRAEAWVPVSVLGVRPWWKVWETREGPPCGLGATHLATGRPSAACRWRCCTGGGLASTGQSGRTAQCCLVPSARRDWSFWPGPASPKPRSPALTLGSILLSSRPGLRGRLLSELDTPRPRVTRAALLRRLKDRHGVPGLGLPRVRGGGVWQGRAGRVAGAPTVEPEVGVAQTPVQGGPFVMGPGPCVPTPRAPAAGPWPPRHRCRLPAEGSRGQTSVWFSEEWVGSALPPPLTLCSGAGWTGCVAHWALWAAGPRMRDSRWAVSSPLILSPGTWLAKGG